jgi:hypothetical protein
MVGTNNQYPEIDASRWQSVGPEATGKGAKEWLVEPETGTKWLFKQPKRGEGKSGDDWAEKISGESYALVGVPHATIELSRRNDRTGVLSRDVRPEQSELILGNEFLSGFDPMYPKESNRGDFYTVRRVLGAIEGLGAPSGLEVKNASAAFAFVGYLLMDALCCAPDRNHTNWGVTRPRESSAMKGVRLAPSFDHGSSLGWELQLRSRIAGLDGSKPSLSPAAYVNRETGVFASPDSPGSFVGVLEAFQEACRLQPEAAAYWLAQLSNVALDDILAVVAKMPDGRMEASAHDYAVGILELTYPALVAMQPWST